MLNSSKSIEMGGEYPCIKVRFSDGIFPHLLPAYGTLFHLLFFRLSSTFLPSKDVYHYFKDLGPESLTFVLENVLTHILELLLT